MHFEFNHIAGLYSNIDATKAATRTAHQYRIPLLYNFQLITSMSISQELFPDLIDEDETVVPSDQQESEEDVHPKPEKINESVMFNTDWTVETLFRQIEKGNINLDPQFQRREAWSAERKSKFIESILCGLPIPNVVLAEDRSVKGKYLVIDGKQRLFSIASFLKNEFSLRNLSIRSELNGCHFSDLQAKNPEDVNAIENYSIRTVVIRNWPDEDYLYTVFYRLNSGSLQLSPQELRKALHAGKLLDFIDEFVSNSNEFKAIFGEKLDPRMRDVELVLRFLAFDRPLSEYNGNLKFFLDSTVQFYDHAWDQTLPELEKSLERFSNSLRATYEIFRSDSFKKWNGSVFERRTNRAVFDVMTRYFSDPEISKRAISKSTAVVEAFKELCTASENFRNSIERTTKTPAATLTRHLLWGEQLAKVIDATLDKVSMRLI